MKIIWPNTVTGYRKKQKSQKERRNNALFKTMDLKFADWRKMIVKNLDKNVVIKKYHKVEWV